MKKIKNFTKLIIDYFPDQKSDSRFIICFLSVSDLNGSWLFSLSRNRPELLQIGDQINGLLQAVQIMKWNILKFEDVLCEMPRQIKCSERKYSRWHISYYLVWSFQICKKMKIFYLVPAKTPNTKTQATTIFLPEILI